LQIDAYRFSEVVVSATFGGQCLSFVSEEVAVSATFGGRTPSTRLRFRAVDFDVLENKVSTGTFEGILGTFGGACSASLIVVIL